MAIYYMDCSLVKRSQGQSVVASAAYRSGSKIKDERIDKTYNYSKKAVADEFIMTPANAPSWASDRAQLWNTVEATEKRKDAQLAREIKVALPVELSQSGHKELLQNYVQENFVSKGMIADCAIHNEDEHNPHAHILLTTREIDSNGFGNKVREWNSKEALSDWRADWAAQTNDYMKAHGLSEKIDHRSYKDQGLDIVPTQHLGPAVSAMERLGIETEKGNSNREVLKQREEVMHVKNEIESTKKEIASAQNAKAAVEPTETKIEPKTEAQQAKDKFMNAKHAVSSNTSEREKLDREKRTLSERLSRADTVNEMLGRNKNERKELTPQTFIQKVQMRFDKPKQERLKTVEAQIKALEKEKLQLRSTRASDVEQLKSINSKIEQNSANSRILDAERKRLNEEMKTLNNPPKSKSKTRKSERER